MLTVIVAYAAASGVLTHQGATAPVVAADDCLERRPGAGMTWFVGCTPARLQGAVIFQNKNCRNCHALAGLGGTRGPDLTRVGMRLTPDQLINQVSNGTPGGAGNMPAYGQQITPAQMTVLVDFLSSLRPAGQPAAVSPAELP